MKILLLEDEETKLQQIKAALNEFKSDIELTIVGNWLDYSRQINQTGFDLILLDLMVPRSAKDSRVDDHCVTLIESTRDYNSKSFRTPAIVLTQYLDQSEEFFSELNKADINVISFDETGAWKEALKLKVNAVQVKVKFDFLVICALDKEADAYDGIVDSFGDLKTVSGLLYREISINEYKGAIVRSPRMGLVSSGITTAVAIERFQPRLVCMSGICGGVPSSSHIYDVLISETCHQHDVGKWSNDGFRSEHYDIPLRNTIRNHLDALTKSQQIKESLRNGITVKQSEYPSDMEELDIQLRLVATSSGSAVIAEEGKTESLSVGQRKLAGFDMEVYSIYDAAHCSATNPLFFAAKAVVDDGDKNKGDRFHRIGCLLSAKFIVAAIRSGITEV